MQQLRPHSLHAHHLAVLLSVALGLDLPAQTTVIYSDDFSGEASSELNGSAPDTRPGTETWLSSTGTPSWKADGSVTGSGQSNAFLPFSPASGFTYTLAVALNPATPSETSDWLAVGFTQTASVSGGYWFSLNASPWMLARVDRSGEDGIQTFLGTNTSEAADHPSAAGVLNLKIVLDTTESEWSVQWFLNDSELRSVAYTANPSISYVALGKMFSAEGAVSSFTLSSVSAVPEPSTYALVLGALLGGFAAVRRRRHRRGQDSNRQEA